MASAAFDDDTERFVSELDEAEQCHMAWTRTVLRCAVLRAAPGSEVLADDAHHACRFDHWLQRHRERLEQLDAAVARRLGEHHEQMHDAARRICRRILAGRAGDVGELDDFERAQAGVVADLALLKTAHLARSARLDALTGLPLRHGLEEEFQRCRAQALRHGERLVALLLDLDEFKRVNDAHGHAAGDLVLQHVATLLRGHCRAGEPVFRLGGEEFLALLQAADHEAARRAAERILQALRDNPLRLADGHTLAVRASAGMAEVGSREPMAAAVGRADEALYAAKAAGRDTWRWAAVH
jgi:diguanylate cyclase (GGDEF)-like protein